MLVLGGGSNVVVADEGFDGTVVEVATRASPPTTRATTPPAAGWWSRSRPVSPGSRSLRTPSTAAGSASRRCPASPARWARRRSRTSAPTARRSRRRSPRSGSGTEARAASRTFAAADCGFGYRTSRFKADPGRHVVLEVTFQFRQGDSAPRSRTPSWPGARGRAGRARADERRTRAVLELRRRKGMVLDAADHDTWSAGSFFTNPVVAADRAARGAPAWPQPDGRVKTSAAWLIERAGFGKGYGDGAARLSTKHTLALPTAASATTAELLALAREIRDGVEQRVRHPAGQRAGAGRRRRSRGSGWRFGVPGRVGRADRGEDDHQDDRPARRAPAARCR